MAKNPNILIGVKLNDLDKTQEKLQKDINKLGKKLNLEITKVEFADLDKVTNKMQKQLNKISKEVTLYVKNIKLGNADSVLNKLNNQIKKTLKGQDIKINTDTNIKKISSDFDDILLKAKQGATQIALLNGELAKMNTVLGKNNDVKSTTLTYQIDSAKQSIEKYGWKAKEVNGEVVQSFELISRKIVDNKSKLENEIISQDKYLTNLENKLNKIKELSIKGNRSNENYDNSKDLESVVNLQNKINEIKSKNIKLSQEEKNTLSQTITELDNLVKKESSYAEEINKSTKFLEGQIKTLENLKNKVGNSGTNNPSEQNRITEELSKQINKYQELINKNQVLGNVEMNRITKTTNSMKMQTNELTKYENTFADIMGKIKDYAIGGSIIYGGIAAAKEGFKDIVEIDTAMRDLKKVSDETTQTYSQFEEQANKTAIAIGSSTKDFIESAAEWRQAGESFKDSELLAKNSTIFQNVGDMSQEESTKTLISVMKSFNMTAKDSMSIMDKINNESNKFSISAQGISEALTRGGSALSVANNDLNETIALITAANSSIQDPARVGNGLKTISMNLRGMKNTAEGAKPKLEGIIKDVTNGQVKITQLNQQGQKEFRSTYDVLLDLHKVWGDLNSQQKAMLGEQIAGKHQANVFFSLMQNAKDLEKMKEAAKDSAGSAMKEQEAYMNSLNGKINALKEDIVGLYTDLGNTDFLKGAIDGLNDMVSVVRKLVNEFGGLPTTIGLCAGAMTAFNEKTRKFMIDNNVAGIGSLEKKYEGLNEKLNRYAKNQESIITTLKANKEAQNVLNQSTTNYATKLGTAQVKLVAFRGAAVAARVATMALQSALSFGVGLIASFAIEKLVEGFSSLQKKIHMTKEQLEEFNNNFIDTSKKSMEDIKAAEETALRIQQLQNQLNNTTNKDEKLNIQKQLVELEEKEAQLLPGSVNARTKEGKAISTSNKAIAEQIKLKKQEMAIEAEKFAKNNKNLKEELEGYAEKSKAYEKLQNDIISGKDINRPSQRTGNYRYDSTTMPQKMDTSDLEKMNKELMDTTQKAVGLRQAIESMKSSGMKDNEINAMFGFDAQKALSSYENSLNEVNDASQDAKNGTNQFGEELLDLGEDAKSTEDKIKDLASSFDKLGSEVDLIKAAMKEFRETGELSAETVGKILNTGDTRLIATLGDANTMLDKMGKLANDVRSEQKMALNSAIVDAQNAENSKIEIAANGTNARMGITQNEMNNKSGMYSNDVNNHGNSEGVKTNNSVNASNNRMNVQQNETNNKSNMYQTDTRNHSSSEDAKGQKAADTTNSIMDSHNNMIDNLGSMYGTDATNYQNLMDEKLGATKTFADESQNMILKMMGSLEQYNYAMADTKVMMEAQQFVDEDKLDADTARMKAEMKAEKNRVKIGYNPVHVNYSGSSYKPSYSKYKPSHLNNIGSKNSGAKQEEKVDIKDIEDQIDRYKALQDVIDDVNNSIAEESELIEQSQGTDKLNHMHKEISLYNDKKKAIDRLVNAKKGEVRELEGILKKNGFKAENGNISNYDERLETIKRNANAMANSNKAKEKAIEDYKKLKEQADRYFAITSSELPNLRKEWLEVGRSIKDTYNSMIEIMSKTEKTTIDIIKNQVDKFKKGLDDSTDKLKETIQKQKDLLNDSFDEDSYQRQLKEKQDTLNKLNAQIKAMERDDSSDGRSRLQDLLKKQEDAEKDLNDFIRDKQKDQANKIFDDEMDKVDKQKDTKSKEIEDKYTPEKLAELSKGMIQKGYIDIEGKVISLRQAVNDYYKDQGELFANSSLQMQEYNNELQMTKKLYSDLNSMYSTLGVNKDNIVKNSGNNTIPITTKAISMYATPQVKNNPNITINSDLNIGTLQEGNQEDIKKMLEDNNKMILREITDQFIN